ncbi:MAG: AraC family transcriptional regulator [Gammaproteobacteria bacterium]|nr:AraC family transcriptional regulator [Gammaproteobacteria bacterium]MDP2140302.1 AraC family transcriptional regulator [Gammaproteobacteria bacterium]MDP2346180.1 AraC family transcriptional regulator [Gammaproteobacteria bacterium]
MANESSDNAYNWFNVPRWYLWEGGYLLIGRAQGAVPLHSHHAIQIVIALDGTHAIRGENEEWRQGAGIIVGADTPHSFDARGALGAMLFVDPESSEGAWLNASVAGKIQIIPAQRLESCVAALRTFVERPLEGMQIRELVRHCVQSLSSGAPRSRGIDPRVTKVLNEIRDADELRITLETAAGMACLSPSRFAHLFKYQTGLPFRKYMLWRKLTRAMVLIGGNRSIADAAYAADFADAAHLTRTFHQMVGLAPSALMRGEFTEIESPFNLTNS